MLWSAALITAAAPAAADDSAPAPAPSPVDTAAPSPQAPPAPSATTAPSSPGAPAVVGPDDCTIRSDEEFIGLDWARRTTYEGVCTSALWLDQKFGDEKYDLKQLQIEGHLGIDLERRQGSGLVVKPKLRLRLRLPNLSRRFDLFFEHDDENKTIVGESDSAVTRQLGSGGQDSTQVGLGYEIMRGINDLLNFRAGIRMTNAKLDPFVRSRYTRTFAKSETAAWQFGETLFYRHIDGFGETTVLDYENRIGGPFIFRWNSSATNSQSTVAFLWGSSVSVLHPLDERRTMHYSYSANGDTGRAVPLGSFGPRVGFRQQLNRRWLFGEFYIGIDRAKDAPGDTRSETGYIGIKLENHFKRE